MNKAPIDDEAAYRKLVANERVKLSATYANGPSIAIFAVGDFAPSIATALSDQPRFAPVLVLICWTMSVAIFRAARQALQDLRL